MKRSVHRDRLALREVFTISRGSRTHADVLRVVIEDQGLVGQGECVPYARYGETMDSVIAQIESVPVDVDHSGLAGLLPGGAARNALDCALWDLKAKQAGARVWDLLGLQAPGAVTTAYTLSLGTPAAMQDQAARNADRPLLKVKLGGGSEDADRIRAVRAGAPKVRIIVDANEGWSADEYCALVPLFADLGVEMIEQPFPAGEDAALDGLERPIAICADESCHDRTSLDDLAGRYDMVNIKLDKTGGLTEALALRDAARDQGFRIMVGCMVGSSLAMAPAHLVAQGAEIVDLDGPLLLAEDRDPAIAYHGSDMMAPDAALWG